MMQRNFKEVLLVGLLIALLGQIHFYPFGTEFRITIAVIMYPFLLLYFRNLSITHAAISVAIFVLITRTAIDITFHKAIFEAAVYRHIPASLFYICYGIIIDRLNFRAYVDRPLYFLAMISFADIASNFLELVLRNHFIIKPFESILETVILAAIIRSLITLCLYWLIKYYNLIIMKEEHQKRYNDLLVITAKMKSEIFFLKKSMQDIESAMEKSYLIYNNINDAYDIGNFNLEQIKSNSLQLSIQIHEIKKDYNRIVMNMEKILPAKEAGNSMKISEIFSIVQGLFSRYIEGLNKDIDLSFRVKRDYLTDKFLLIISILNNLLQNSIEACINEKSYISVLSEMHWDKIIIKVADNGKDIPEMSKDLIFEPGYTTKYDPNTGLISTGLGLTHVKMLTEHLSGSITVNSMKSGGKEFVLTFPAKELVSEGKKDA